MMGVKTTANSAKKVLAVIDTDGSGEISFDEFKTFFAKVRNPNELRNMLSATNQRFLEYKAMVGCKAGKMCKNVSKKMCGALDIRSMLDVIVRL